MGQIKSTPAKALKYISRPDATNEGLWVSTNTATIIDASDYKAVARQFGDTARTVGASNPRPGSVLAHHVIQSFDPKDGVDAATAHRIGVQFAEKITGGDHEYMIATHLDKGHVHNHIIMNAVNRETGRKFRVQKSTIGQFRDISDELCQSEGLSVLPKPERATGQSLADIYSVLKGESAKQFIRTEIDKAAQTANSWTEFEAVLARAGIETSTRGGRNGTVSFREISMARAVRDYRLGIAYTEGSIMARLARQVVNQIGIDVSMVTRETEETLTVAVPRTKRQLHLTVDKKQVVRHGRALRIYVPANTECRLADAQGNLAETVKTNVLYQWFSEPDLVGVTSYVKTPKFDGSFNKWRNNLSELRSLEARVNAKSRWMNDPEHSAAGTALEQARAFVVERHFIYQTTLVATTELMASGDPDTEQLAALQAQLRILEREIETAKSDIHALTQLTKEEAKMSVSDRINTQANATRGVVEQVQQQKKDERTKQRFNRESLNRADEQAADALTLDDAEQDRDGGTRSMTLQDRLVVETEKLRARKEAQEAPDGTGRDADGRTR